MTTARKTEAAEMLTIAFPLASAQRIVVAMRRYARDVDRQRVDILTAAAKFAVQAGMQNDLCRVDASVDAWVWLANHAPKIDDELARRVSTALVSRIERIEAQQRAEADVENRKVLRQAAEELRRREALSHE